MKTSSLWSNFHRYMSGTLLVLFAVTGVLKAQITTVHMYDNIANNFSGNGISGNYRTVGSSLNTWRFQRTGSFTGNNFWKVNNQPNNTDNDFNNPSGSKVWSAFVAVNDANASTYFAYGNGNGDAGSYPVTNGRFYAFTFLDVNTSSNSRGYIMETINTPVTISTVTRTPGGTIAAGTPVTISGTISANLPSDQNLYIRYSTNANFSTSTINSIGTTGSNSFSTTIPASANTNGTTVYYYIFTSTYGLSSITTDTELKTIELSNVFTYTPACPTVNAGGTLNICSNSTGNVLTGASIGGSASTAAWSVVSGGGTLSSTDQTANPELVTYTPAPNYVGPVVLALTTNAPGNCTAATMQRTLNVSALPTATITGASTVCSGTNTILKASGGTSFNWNNAGFTNNPTTTIVAPAASASVIVRDANGCSSAPATANITYINCTSFTSNASAPAYNSGFTSGLNDNVCGFGNWIIANNNNPAQSGAFIATAANTDCNILTNGEAWAIYANNNGNNNPTSNAVRPFASNMTPNAQLSFRFENGIIAESPSGTVGFGIQNSAGENLMEVFFIGGGANYSKNDLAGVSLTDLGFTDGGLNVVFTLTSATTYVVTLNSIANPAVSEVISGTLLNPAGGRIPNRIRFFNFRGGAIPGTNTYFNDINLSLTNNPFTAVLSGGGSICPANTSNLSVSITDPAGLVPNGYTVVYNPGNIVVNNYTNGAPIPVTPGVTTNYTLVSVTRNTGSCNASVSGSANVIVNNPPTIGGATSVQVGISANVTPNTDGTWQSSNPTVATINDNGLVNGLSVGQTTLTFTNALTGCSSSVLFNVFPAPPLAAGSGSHSDAAPTNNLFIALPPAAFINGTAPTVPLPQVLSHLRITEFPAGVSRISVGQTGSGGSFSYGTIYNSNNPADVAALTALLIPTDATGRPTQKIMVDPTIFGDVTITVNFKVRDNLGNESSNTGQAVLTLDDSYVRQDFEDNSRADLQANCWTFPDADPGRVGNLNCGTLPAATWGNYTYVSGQLTNETQNAGAQTPYLFLQDAFRVQFDYIMGNTTGTSRLMTVRLIDATGGVIDITTPLEVVNTTTCTQISFDQTFNLSTFSRAPGLYRVFVNFRGGGGTKRAGIDNIRVTGEAYCPRTLSGKVFNDTNGLTDGRVDDGNGTNINGTLYVNLVQGTTVRGSKLVNNDGTFTFGIAENLTPGVAYNVILTTSAQSIGGTLSTASLPAGWVHTGEFAGAGAGNDGNANGILNSPGSFLDVINIHFGIQQIPTAGSGMYSTANLTGTQQIAVPANTFTNTQVSSDIAPGNVTGIRITAFPAGATSIVVNGTTYLAADVAALTALIIPADVNGNPTVSISVDPASELTGIVTIPFKAVDNGLAESANTGTAVINLTCLPCVTYRTKNATGNWSDANNWERENCEGVFENATTAPPMGARVEIRGTVMQDVDFTVINCPLVLASDAPGSLIIMPNRTLSFGGGADGNAYFNSKPVVVQSTAAGTGAIGTMLTNSRTLGDDNVTLERYLPDSKRRWNLLTFGVSSSTATIRDAWGGGNRTRVSNSANRGFAGWALGNYPGKPNNVPWPAPADYVPGDGTIITGHRHVNATTANRQGFDWWPELIIPRGDTFWVTSTEFAIADRIANTPSSIRPYNPTGTTELGPGRGTAWISNADLNTNYRGLGKSIVNATLNEAEQGYLLFTRGDRMVLENWYNATTLRPRGQLKTGNIEVPVFATAAQKLTVVGNPYPAPVSMEKVYTHGSNSNVIKDIFYIWDSNLDGANELGAWRTFTRRETSPGEFVWEPVPFIAGNAPVVSSSAAFLVEGTASGGQLLITESMKSAIQEANILPFDNNAPQPSVTGMLHVNFGRILSNNQTGIIDGVGIMLGNGFTEDIADAKDTRKIFNFNSESSFSILHDSIAMGIEAAPYPAHQSVFPLQTIGLGNGKYVLQFYPRDLQKDGLEAYLIDRHQGTEWPINLTAPALYEFVTNSEQSSKASNRFEIVFKQATTLPVTIVSVKAQAMQGNVQVEWKAATESGMRHYEVEYSNSGSAFQKIGRVMARNQNGAVYNFLHQQPGNGNHFYRIRSEDTDGKTSFTQVVKVAIGQQQSGMVVSPNILSGTTRVNLELNGLSRGNYTLQLTDMSGRTLMALQLSHDGTASAQSVSLPANLAAGKYLLRLTNGEVNITEPLIKL